MDATLAFYTLPNVIFTSVGAVILWCKLGKQELTVFGLGKLWAEYVGNERWRNALELISFVLLGVGLGIAFTRPSNVVQAFTAGLGWTGLLATSKAVARARVRKAA